MTDAAIVSAQAVSPEPRKLGRWMTTSLVVGNMIGSGAFLLPASLAPLGWNSVFGWLVTIAGGMCLAAVFCWLVRAMPGQGAPYAYTHAAFGPLVAFLVTWSYWMSVWIGNAAIATAAISYLSVLVPPAWSLPGGAPIATCMLIWTLTLVNVAGARAAGGLQLMTTVLKLMPLVLTVLLAALVLSSGRAHLQPFDAGAISGSHITAAATLTLWGLLGLESATVPAGRVADPERTIPFATLWGTFLTGVVYLVTCSAVVLLMPTGMIASSSAPFADFVARFWAPGPALLIALFAAISGMGALNGWILLQAELPCAMARAGAFPRWFGVESKRGVPVRALIVSSALMTIVVLMNFSKSTAQVFNFLLLLSTTTTLFMYLACMLAALKLGALRRAGRVLSLLAGLGSLYALWTIYGAGAVPVAWGVALLLAGIPIYALMRTRVGGSG